MNVKLTISTDKELHKKLKAYCANQGISMKDYIVGLVKKDMNNKDKE